MVEGEGPVRFEISSMERSVSITSRRTVSRAASLYCRVGGSRRCRAGVTVIVAAAGGGALPFRCGGAAAPAPLPRSVIGSCPVLGVGKERMGKEEEPPHAPRRHRPAWKGVIHARSCATSGTMRRLFDASLKGIQGGGRRRRNTAAGTRATMPEPYPDTVTLSRNLFLSTRRSLSQLTQHLAVRGWLMPHLLLARFLFHDLLKLSDNFPRTSDEDYRGFRINKSLCQSGSA